MTVTIYDANGRDRVQYSFSCEMSLVDFMKNHSPLLSNFSIFKEDIACVYRLATDGSFRLFMTFDCNARVPVCIYSDPLHWGSDLAWAD